MPSRLSPDDTGISRLAGSIEADSGTWWVVNRSASRPLTVIDELGFRSVLPPGRRYAVEGRVRVVVDGSHGSHELDISGPLRVAPTDVLTPGESTAVGAGVTISQDDRLALVALFAGYLEEGNATIHTPSPTARRQPGSAGRTAQYANESSTCATGSTRRECRTCPDGTHCPHSPSTYSPLLNGPFHLIEFALATPVVHIEHYSSAAVLWEERDVRMFRDAVEWITESAMTPERTSEAIAELIQEMEKEAP